MKPKLSILLCTFNGEALLPSCLDSIFRQTYADFEILCIDGGSEDNTCKLISEYAVRDSRVRLISNPKRLPEGRGYGKWLGARAAQGDILAIIDQDNILQRDDLFANAVTLLKPENQLLGVLGGLSHYRCDLAALRFISIFGTDSFFAYRSIDFLRSIGVGIKADCIAGINFERVEMTLDNMSLTGGNCFFYRSCDVAAAGGYDQDVLLVQRLILQDKTDLAIIPNATKHYSESSLRRLAFKKFFWAQKFFQSKSEQFNYLPTTGKERRAFFRNLLFNLLILPNMYYAAKTFVRFNDWVVWLFPLIAFLNTVAYGVNFISSRWLR